MKIPLLAGVLLLGGLAASSAADVTLKANDAAGTSSFTGSGNWSSGAAPAPGNTYFTTNTSGVGLQMRTPTGLVSNVFVGDALVLCPNPTYGSVSLLIKGNQGSYAVVNNLILDGGSVGNGGNSTGVNTTNTLAGFINVVSAARFDSGGSGRAIVVAAPITNGVGPITCTNAGSIWMFGTNSGFAGRMAVIGSCTLRITNQFNLGGNPASFTADQLLLDNGTLSVTNSVSLDDSGRGITLSTNGGKFDVAADATLTLPNPITGRGSLTKTGAGTLILSGANSYTNGTVVSSGILSVRNSFALGTNGTVNQASGGRNSTIQLQGDIAMPAAVNFTLSNDGTGTTSLFTTNAIQNLSGNNTINGTITLTVGGGSAVIQSDSGALVLAGNIRIASGQTSRGVILQGASTAANTISGSITDLSASSVNSVIKTGTGSWTLSGTNTYTGATTINGGTLALSGNGSIANTPLISIASGATFDVSGLSSPFTLGAGQSLSNSTGTVKGSLATAGGSSIYPATAGEAGTLTCNGDLNLSAGGTVTFDLSASAAGGNDMIAVGGNLTLSSSDYIHINAMSGFLDTADYVLFSVGTGTTMPTTPVLVWDGAVPGNYLNYRLLQVGNNVVLHYSSSTAPSVMASVNPTFGTRFQTVTVTANVTKGSGNIAGVTVDLTQIGGAAVAGLVLDSANSTPPAYVYTNTFLVPASTPVGDKSLTVTATDDSSPTPLTGTYIITPLTITANTVTWSGGASDNQWTSNPNWTSDIGPGFIGDSITFSGFTRLTPDMNANYSVASLAFDSTAGAFTLGSSTGSTLTNSGGILNNSSSAQTLNVPMVISAAQTLNAAVGNLTVNSNVSLGGNALTVDGAATTAIGGVISGTAGLTKNGSGTLVLSNANTYGNNGAADTALNGGTVVIGHDLALGTSRLNIADGGAIQSADSSTRLITNRLNFGSGAGGNAI
ncbi:MAG TPA: autotransporter-associated beta strand repeat-containing protein, partial [Candidatus Sulfotelmatobacter sp.]|nr:autotransporter-associated beta strand repeat-containing protein [Candidatus Sulfotelmatobacter sp.]